MKKVMITLYRPVGEIELNLIKESDFKAFPPRLSWQPIFYPVLDLEYACTIAKDWNTKDEANGYVGIVTQFEIPFEYFKKFETQNVGASNHTELWVPAEELETFNSKIIGGIKITKIFYEEKYKGERTYEY